MNKWILLILFFSNFLNCVSEDSFQPLYFPVNEKELPKNDFKIESKDLTKLFDADFVKQNITFGHDYSLLQNSEIEDTFLLLCNLKELDNAPSKLSVFDENVKKANILLSLFKKPNCSVSTAFCILISKLKDNSFDNLLKNFFEKRLISFYIPEVNLSFAKELNLKEIIELEALKAILAEELKNRNLYITYNLYTYDSNKVETIIDSEYDWQKAIYRSYYINIFINPKVISKENNIKEDQSKTLNSHNNEEEENFGLSNLFITQDFFCELCNIICTSQETLDFHLEGKKHKHKVEVIENQTYCPMCNSRSTNAHGYQLHINGAKHKARYKTIVSYIKLDNGDNVILKGKRDLYIDPGHAINHKYIDTNKEFIFKKVKSDSVILNSKSFMNKLEYKLNQKCLGQVYGLPNPESLS